MDRVHNEGSQLDGQRSKKGNEGGTGDRPEHRRSKSGSLLSGLSFLRSSKETVSKQPVEKDGAHLKNDGGTKRESSIATALRQNQGRQRKGSLRKAALAKMRERSSSLRKERTPGKPPTIITTMSTTPLDDRTTHHRFNYDHASLNSSSDSGWQPEPNLFVPTSSATKSHEGVSPITSPTGPYASTTTDDDEALSFFRPSLSSTSSFNVATQGPAMSLSRRRSTRSDRRSSLAEVQTPSDLDLDDEWDYSETEWWGWVVLVATWIVFVVGMGSCLGVWSWAWDVGETPYAPPELEDDESLPITGYYPALMVCTAVMSWVWVVVAWVGMKYFRHAKVVGEEGY